MWDAAGEYIFYDLRKEIRVSQNMGHGGQKEVEVTRVEGVHSFVRGNRDKPNIS